MNRQSPCSAARPRAPSGNPRTSSWGVLVTILLTVVALVPLLAMPQIASANDGPNVRSPKDRPVPKTFKQEPDVLTAEQLAALRAMEIFSSAWFLVLGATVGSFLNVVISRMPAGIPLSRPKSRCPFCLTPIGLRDNIPIVSWLRLRGRCRTCRAPIPARYLIVELMVGVLFLALVWLETFSGGKTIPLREPNQYAGVIWILWYTKWDLIGLYLYHAFLLSVLTAMALIVQDGNSLPRRLLAWSFAVGWLFPVVWPHLHPVPFQIPYPEWVQGLRWSVEWQEPIFSGGWRQSFGFGVDGALDGLIGAIAGAGIGWLASLEILPVKNGERPRDVVLLASLIGTFVGWQAVFSVALISIAVRLVGLGSAWVLGLGRIRRSPTLAGCLSIGVVLQLFLWRGLTGISWWPGPFSGSVSFASTGLILAVTAVGLRLSRRAADLPSQPEAAAEKPDSAIPPSSDRSLSHVPESGDLP